MQKMFFLWRVRADWMEAQVLMPTLPFEWLRGPKAEWRQMPTYSCYGIIFETYPSYEAMRQAFGDGICGMLIVPHTRATAAEWHRVKHEPGAVRILPDQQGPRIG